MAFFSFLGANQYLREVEEQQRYEEAFDLKQQSLGLSQANLELQKENLELKKIQQEQNLILNYLPFLNKGIGTSIGTKKGKGLGSVVGGTGTSGKDNKYYAGVIKRMYPYVDNETLASITANTDNAPGTMKTIYDFLNDTKEQFASKNRLVGGEIPQETIEYIFNNTFQKTTKPYESIKDLEKQFGLKLSESSKGMLDILTDYSVTNVELPKITEPLGLPESKDIEFLKKEAYDVSVSFYNNENKAITRALKLLKEKENNRGGLNSEESMLFSWLTKRGGELDKIKGQFSRDNDTLLTDLYGTREAYNYMRVNSPLGKRMLLGEQPPSLLLAKEPPPILVQNKEQMITLRNLGVLRPGQPVEFVQPIMENGVLKSKGLVPAKGQN